MEPETPVWSSQPLDIHHLLEQARINLVGHHPSVPLSGLTRHEVGFASSTMERRYRISIRREHTGYQHIHTAQPELAGEATTEDAQEGLVQPPGPSGRGWQRGELDESPSKPQQWTVHRLAIDPLDGWASARVVAREQTVYDMLPESAWARHAIHA